MRTALLLFVSAIALSASPKPQVAIEVGVAPDCPYGYYDSTPYSCAPYGYYGPEWFTGGIFIGAGPWFHGGSNFRGHVNNHYHPEHGYKGSFPQRGEKASRSGGKFRGNEVRNGSGKVGKGRK